MSADNAALADAKILGFSAEDADDACSEGTLAFNASMLVTLPEGLAAGEDAFDELLSFLWP